MSEQVRNALHELARQTPPVRLPDDVWAVGRRQRRRARTVGVLAAVAVVLLVAVGVPLGLRSGGPVHPVAAGEDAVPGRVHHPWFWQATVAQSPPGRASVMFSGGRSLGLRGIDGPDDEGKVAVVGRGGDYRMLLRGAVESVAGEDLRLSPDGRYVAHDGVGETEQWLVLTDLTTGREQTLAGPAGGPCCGWPVAWAPDGRSLLALDYPGEPVGYDAQGYDIRPSRLVLVDVASGSSRVLADGIGNRYSLRTASLAAFAPDGRWIVVTIGDRLVAMDLTGAVRWSRDLGPGRVLAGPGAVTPDGTRIVTATLDGCSRPCDSRQLTARTWRFGTVDAATGTDAADPGLAPLHGLAVRVLGWRHGTDLVTLRYDPEPDGSNDTTPWNDTGYWEAGHVQLVALRSGGGTELLLDPPAGVLAMDIPQDLLTAGQFGGPDREPEPFPARPVILLLGLPLIPIAVVVLVLLWVRRQIRSAAALRGRSPARHPDPPYPPPPPGTGTR